MCRYLSIDLWKPAVFIDPPRWADTAVCAFAFVFGQLRVAAGVTWTMVFWKAYLSIKQPLTAHGPIHPQVSSRQDP